MRSACRLYPCKNCAHVKTFTNMVHPETQNSYIFSMHSFEGNTYRKWVTSVQLAIETAGEDGLQNQSSPKAKNVWNYEIQDIQKEKRGYSTTARKQTRWDQSPPVILHLLPEALFISPVFSPPKNVEICGDLVFTQYSQIPSNTLPQKYSTMMESF
jgi:hypothetical protein